VTWPVRITSRTPEKPAQWGGQAGPRRPGKGTAVYGVLWAKSTGSSCSPTLTFGFVIPSERRAQMIGEGRGAEVPSGYAKRI